jgi:hypothetical protein
VLVVACALVLPVVAGAPARATADGTAARACTRGTFKNFHDEGTGAPPPGYSGPTFQLSQAYPESLVPEAGPWMTVPIAGLSADEGARAYLAAVYGYVTQGNVEADWIAQKNTVRPWFHAPWLDTTANGREFIHGLTHERDAASGLLDANREQTWSIGAFNAPGAWAIGQMWCDPANPDPNALNPTLNGPNSFPAGTAIYKLLFSTADPAKAPFLAGTYQWSADVLAPTTTTQGAATAPDDPPRTQRTVSLVQMDVAVRDDRLPNGWAYGTFAYIAKAPGTSIWERMVPVGLMWGNDPGVTPSMVAAGVKLRQTWMNDDPVLASAPPHRGWAGRLVGPLDNQESSCMSCHQTAGQPFTPFLATGRKGQILTDRDRLPWFANTPAGVAFDAVLNPDDPAGPLLRTSTDYSLQVSMGLQRFVTATCPSADATSSNSTTTTPTFLPVICSATTASAGRSADGSTSARNNGPFEPFEQRRSTRRGLSLPWVGLIAALVLLVGVPIGRRSTRVRTSAAPPSSSQPESAP